LLVHSIGGTVYKNGILLISQNTANTNQKKPEDGTCTKIHQTGNPSDESREVLQGK